MAINTNPPIPNPQLINGMHFRTRLNLKDLMALILVWNNDDEGLSLTSVNDAEKDSIRNLMRHGLIKIDFFEREVSDMYPCFSVTEAGKELVKKAELLLI
jgi:hypothetical protein